MLPARNRANPSLYRKGKIEGTKIADDDFRLTFFKKPRVFKVAVIVSKKVAKKAVDRNRIKRLIYEALRTSGLIAGELVINVNTNLSAAKKVQIEVKLSRLLKKLNEKTN